MIIYSVTKGQEKVKVACGLIDAHAGVLGLLATQDIQNFESTLCLIRGAIQKLRKLLVYKTFFSISNRPILFS